MVTFSLSPSKQTERWIERAAHLAVNDAATGNTTLGAIIVKGGGVLSVGTTYATQRPALPSRHAARRLVVLARKKPLWVG